MSSTQRRIRTAAAVVAAGVLLSRILGFARTVVLANILGDSAVSDAYETAFIIPDILNYLLAGGFLAITFIPILSERLAAGDESAQDHAFNAVFRPIAVIIVALTIVGMLSMGWLIDVGFGSRLDASQLVEVTRLTRIILPAQIFFILGGLFTAVQYVQGRFVIPTLAPIIYNLGIIIGGLVGSIGTSEPTATGFMFGALAGAFAGNFALQWWGAHRVGLRVKVGRLDFRHPDLRAYLVLAIPLMVGQSIVVLDESLGKWLVQSATDGAVFSLTVARRVNMLPIGVIAQAAGVAAYPFFARLVAEGRFSEMRESMGKTIQSVVYISGLAVAGLIAVSQPAIRVAFQHGNFTQSGTVLAASALVAYAISIPAWGVHQIFARGLYAHRQMWVPVAAGTAWSIVAIPMYVAAFDEFGVPGVAMASSVAITGYAITLAILWGRRHTFDGLSGLIGTAARTGAGTIVSAFAGWTVANAITGGDIPSFGTGIVSVVAGLAVTAVVYVGVTWLARSEDARRILHSS